jgi:hypothetical protein
VRGRRLCGTRPRPGAVVRRGAPVAEHAGATLSFPPPRWLRWGGPVAEGSGAAPHYRWLSKHVAYRRRRSSKGFSYTSSSPG